MKRFGFFVLTVLFFTGMASAETLRQENEMTMKAAKVMIERTSSILREAQKAARAGKNFTGDLAHAVSNQRYAIKLFREKAYVPAMNHTLRARELARKVIRANKGVIPIGEEVDQEPSVVPGDELDKIVISKMPEEASKKDSDVVELKLDLEM